MPTGERSKNYSATICSRRERSTELQRHKSCDWRCAKATSQRCELTSNSVSRHLMYCFLIPRLVFVTDRKNNRSNTEDPQVTNNWKGCDKYHTNVEIAWDLKSIAIHPTAPQCIMFYALLLRSPIHPRNRRTTDVLMVLMRRGYVVSSAKQASKVKVNKNN